jgi:hypothetical protein
MHGRTVRRDESSLFDSMQIDMTHIKLQYIRTMYVRCTVVSTVQYFASKEKIKKNEPSDAYVRIRYRAYTYHYTYVQQTVPVL